MVSWYPCLPFRKRSCSGSMPFFCSGEGRLSWDITFCVRDPKELYENESVCGLLLLWNELGKLIVELIIKSFCHLHVYSEVASHVKSSIGGKARMLLLRLWVYETMGSFSFDKQKNLSTKQNPCQTSLIWVFPKIMVPQNGWFIMEIPIKMDDLGVPIFLETPILRLTKSADKQGHGVIHPWYHGSSSIKVDKKKCRMHHRNIC